MDMVTVLTGVLNVGMAQDIVGAKEMQEEGQEVQLMEVHLVADFL